MKRRNKVFAAAVVTTCFVATAAFSAFAAEPAVKMEGLEISSIADMSVSEFGTNNTDTGRAEHDTGHIYVGIAATDGVIDEANSNWADKAEQAEGAYTIEFNDEVEGEGFTALRAFGEGEYSVSGNLYLHDEGDGTYDSDFTGMGAAVTAANGAKVYVNGMNYLSEGIVRSFGPRRCAGQGLVRRRLARRYFPSAFRRPGEDIRRAQRQVRPRRPAALRHRFRSDAARHDARALLPRRCSPPRPRRSRRTVPQLPPNPD